MKNESISFQDLFSEVQNNIKDNEELATIKKAYLFASDKHKGMKRLNGEDFISHPLNVAMIVNSLNVDATTIIAAILHEVMNNGDTTFKELESEFGSDVATIVDLVTKINKLELVDESESSAMYLRKVLVGLATDVRVLFIKLADRLHNMRTNYAIDPKKQKQKAYEAQAVLVPIAHRLGINSIKSELEDLCLYYTKPDAYNDILDKLNESRDELNNSLNEMKQSIIDILVSQGLKFEIKGRVKSVHGIYNKLASGRKWSDIYDILALRVILEKESDCYLAAGLVHAKYRPIPKRFKDYIANPKANMYQSLHTTVFGIDGHLFEIQFRTYEMDEFAEKGLASHWSYKEHGTKKAQAIMDQKLELFRNLIETQSDADDNSFFNDINSDMLSEMIYIYTPKGDVVELPKGSTPVDFAYRIHSDVGDKMVGAIVNDSIVPLNYELQNDDIVKIKTNPNASPNKDWLNIVKTSQAKNKIKSYFSKQERTFMISKGKEILERELRKKKISFNDFFSDDNVKKILKELKLKEVDDIYLSVGTLRYTAAYIIGILSDEEVSIEDALIEKVNSRVSSKNNYKNDIIVSGVGDILVNLAKCCKPVKGDNIIGYITKGQGITVHRDNCQNIVDKTRVIDVAWNSNSTLDYLSDIYIEVLSNKNYLTDIVAAFTKRNMHIDSFKTKDLDDGVLYEVTVKVKSKEEIDKIIVDLDNLTFVSTARRL